jgi:hypothetical protein
MGFELHGSNDRTCLAGTVSVSLPVSTNRRQPEERKMKCRPIVLDAFLLTIVFLTASVVSINTPYTQLQRALAHPRSVKLEAEPPSGQWLYFPFPFEAAVNTIWVDDHGGAWLATDDGLALFDGYEFAMFFEKLDLHTVGGDNQGNLVITDSFGKAHFFRESNFETYAQVQVVSELAMEPIPQIESVLMDSKGNAWFACQHQGLAKYDDQTLEWIQYSVLSFIFTDLAEGQDGTIWVSGIGNCTSGGYAGVASRRADGSWESHRCTESGLAADDFLALSVDQQGYVWVLDSFPSIFMFDGSRWETILSTRQAQSYNMAFPSYFSRDIWAHSPQSIWLAEHLKLLLFDGTEWWPVARTEHEWKFMQATRYDSLPYGLSHLGGDRQGVVYAVVDLLGADYNKILESGLLVFVPAGAELPHYAPHKDPQEMTLTPTDPPETPKEGRGIPSTMPEVTATPKKTHSQPVTFVLLGMGGLFLCGSCLCAFVAFWILKGRTRRHRY